MRVCGGDRVASFPRDRPRPRIREFRYGSRTLDARISSRRRRDGAGRCAKRNLLSCTRARARARSLRSRLENGISLAISGTVSAPLAARRRASAPVVSARSSSGACLTFILVSSVRGGTSEGNWRIEADSEMADKYLCGALLCFN